MKFIKGRFAWFSVVLLSAGYVAAPPVSVAQATRQEPDSVQAAPNGARQNDSGRSERYQNRENSRLNAWRWNNRSAEPRGRDRERDRGRNDRKRNHFNPYWSAPYYPNSFGQGFYYVSPRKTGYSDGFNAGRYDKIQGNYYNPRQYERSGDLDYFEGFVEGYEDGWRR